VKWTKHLLIFIVVFLALGYFFRGGCAPGGTGGGPPPDARFVEVRVPGLPGASEHQAGRSYALRAEVADTVEKRQKGLSGRRGLEPGHAMLYVYLEPRTPEFTGGSTPFPLSTAFLRDDGTIASIHKTEPKDATRFGPEEPVRYALEVRQGWFEDRGLKAGDRVEISGYAEEVVEESAAPEEPPPPAEAPDQPEPQP